jgi:hypothetical protein
MFPNIERASHSLVQRQINVWAVKTTVVVDAHNQGRTHGEEMEGTKAQHH